MNRLTRNLILASLLLISPFAFADGFRCAGQGYHVKLYDRVVPADGTRSVAKIIVSQEGIGTLAVLDAENTPIRKLPLADSVLYTGTVNSDFDGRFFSIAVELQKAPRSDDNYDATLTITGDHAETDIDMLCYRYLRQRD